MPTTDVSVVHRIIVGSKEMDVLTAMFDLDILYDRDYDMVRLFDKDIVEEMILKASAQPVMDLELLNEVKAIVDDIHSSAFIAFVLN